MIELDDKGKGRRSGLGDRIPGALAVLPRSIWNKRLSCGKDSVPKSNGTTFALSYNSILLLCKHATARRLERKSPYSGMASFLREPGSEENIQYGSTLHYNYYLVWLFFTLYENSVRKSRWFFIWNLRKTYKMTQWQNDF